MIIIRLRKRNDEIVRIRIQGHARKGRLKDRVCTGVAVLSRTLASMLGEEDAIAYGKFNLRIPKHARKEAMYTVYGYEMLQRFSPENVRIIEEVA